MSSRTLAPGVARYRLTIDKLSDARFMSLLEDLRPLPDTDDDPRWQDDLTWDGLELLLACADSVGDRRLIEAIAPVFRAASLGGAFGHMQGIRHGPERAVDPDWRALAQVMRTLTHDPRAGCRRWSVRELGILRYKESLDDLVAALRDPEPTVRCEACCSLSALGSECTAPRQLIRSALSELAQGDESAAVRQAAAEAAADLDD
jgi:hypothetical protein